MRETSELNRRPGGWRRAWRLPAVLVGAPLGLFLMARAVVEFATINYADPASYRGDWGGPTLAGVLAVHAGPGLAIAIAGAWFWLRRGQPVHRRAIRR